jgi:tRNA pseudouridine38-40 synthase
MEIKNERNIKLTVAYDGTNYHGFQRQANALTVQQVLEERLAKVFGHPLKMTGAGRTDSGVHAYGQVVNFYTTGTVPTQRIVAASKGLLPRDIVIQKAEAVASDFHARYSAKSKIYIYRVLPEVIADPFMRNFAWHIPYKLNIQAMHEAAQAILGEHDFSAFRAAGGPPVSPIREIVNTYCRLNGREIEFLFWGTGFLYHMVRNLVGTLVDIGYGKLSVDGFKKVLEGRDRTKAGVTAPPQGLYLKEVKY